MQATRQLGMIPHWMNRVEDEEGLTRIRVMGMLSGLAGSADPYAFVTHFDLNGADGDAMYARLMVSSARYYPRGQTASDFMRVDPDRVLPGMDAYYAKDSTSTRWFELAEEFFQREQDAERLSKLRQLIVRHRIYLGK